MPVLDAAIADIARKQGGHVTRRQLLDLGLTAREIDHRLAIGRLIRVYQGVYAVGCLPTSPVDRAAGALLACGPGSALSYGSGASLWGIFKDWRFPLEVTVPRDRRTPGITIHRSARLTRADIRVHCGVRVLKPALIVLQVAPRLPPKRLKRVVNDVRLELRVPLKELQHALDRFPRHPGARHLRPIVEESGPEPTRSTLEDDWPPFATAHSLPPYAMNRHVCGYRVDVLFPAERLIVEIDGWDSHSTREAFERDRRQDADILESAGIPTVRTTWRRLKYESAQEAVRLQAILSRRRSEFRPPERRSAA